MTTIKQFLAELEHEEKPKENPVNYKLIEINKPPRSAEKIRESFLNSNIESEDKALSNYGSKGLREHYNRPNLRKRALMESGQEIKFQTNNIIFISSDN